MSHTMISITNFPLAAAYTFNQHTLSNDLVIINKYLSEQKTTTVGKDYANGA